MVAMECKKCVFCMCYAQIENKEKYARKRNTLSSQFLYSMLLYVMYIIYTNVMYVSLPHRSDIMQWYWWMLKSHSLHICICICICIFMRWCVLSDVMLYDKLIWPSNTNFRAHITLTTFQPSRLFLFFFFVIVIDGGVGLLRIGRGKENGNENDIHHYFSVLDYFNF